MFGFGSADPDYFEPSDTPASRALIDEIAAAARLENQSAARRLAAIGKLFESRRVEREETKDWAIDSWAAVGAEVAAKLRISVSMANSYIYYARAMNERLPKVAEVFAEGEIDFRTFQTIVYRTDLIKDEDSLAVVDAQVAERARRWPSMTQGRLSALVDRIVARVDRDAVRQKRKMNNDREVEIWDLEAGMSGMAGSLFTADAKLLDQRLDALADSVCPADPRTREQRRADALGALAAGLERLSCRCDSDDCAAGGRVPNASNVVIHIVADQATVEGRAETPGHMVETNELIPAELIAELAREARLRPLFDPAGAPPEPGYRPSQKLADFVRCRDLTCRAPGCDVPAIDCDIDHTIPFSEGGLTHASNLKCYCRTHHLLKTFWGWRDKQLPDATVIWTLPSGQTYVTTPGSALLFPTLCAPTADLPPQDPKPEEPTGDRTVMMPRRNATRAESRARYIAAERARNRKLRNPREWVDIWDIASRPPHPDDEPPPF